MTSTRRIDGGEGEKNQVTWRKVAFPHDLQKSTIEFHELSFSYA
jgi:hypothetical protein